MNCEWENKKLADVANIIDSLHKTPKYIDDPTGFPMVRVTDINSKDLKLSGAKRVDLDTYNEFSKKYKPKVGDIIFSRVGSYGRSSIVQTNEAFCLGQNTAIIVPTINSEFLYYYLNSPSAKEQIDSFVSGTTQPTVSLKNIKNIEIPIPTIDEQKHIVSIIDKAFIEIEKARSNAEINLKNAEELFDSSLQQTFSRNHGDWNTTNLKSITSKIGSGATPKGGKAAYKSEGMSLIRSMNVHDRQFKEKDLALIDDDQASKLSNVELLEGDVLLNITGASVARCCVVPHKYLPARVNQHVSIIRVNDNTIKPELLCYLLTSKYYKDILLGIGEAGSTRQAITKAQIENFEISFPKGKENQDKFIKQLSMLEGDVLKLQRIYTKKLEALDELKKSILQKAFNGELTKSKGAAA